jgi:diguanylate cyclase (GGDEF)-like protein
MSPENTDIHQYKAKLLDLVTDTLPDMLWIKDTEGNYIYANKAICDGLLMAKDTQEPIGKGDVFFALRERAAHADKPQWHTFGELCFNSDQVVIDNKKPMRFEEYGNVKGKMLYLEVYKAPYYDYDGTIIGTVGAGRDITKLKQTQLELEESLKRIDHEKDRFEYQATHDALTDLPNRILLFDRLDQCIKSAERNHRKIAVVFIDLDYFKEINDSLGHSIGDQVLVQVTQRMMALKRSSDTLARLGGDEFCLILNDVNTIDDISKILVQRMEIVKEPFEIEGKTLYLGMSMGVSIFPDDGKDTDTLLKNADAAMYKAKDDGRNTYAFYNQKMTEKAFERIFLETALREGISKKELIVYYQPQVDIVANKVIGMEALVRWVHPTMGMITPDQFIPLAEDTGMIVQLDRMVMEMAISQVSQWREAGIFSGFLSLNLAVKQLEDPSFVDFFKALLAEQKFPTDAIEFEVTESQIMNKPEASIGVLQKISDLGVRLSVDDFGTGYSSLAYLKKLPIQKLKIDRSFIKDLPTDNEDIAISKTIIGLGDNLNLDVIAEGVETKDQVEFLLQNGCNKIQGYYYSKPIPADEMLVFLKAF